MTPLSSTSYPSYYDSTARDAFGYPIETQEVDDGLSHSDSALGYDADEGTSDSIPRDTQGYPIETQSTESGLSGSSAALGYDADESSSPLSSDLALSSKTTFSSSSSISDSFMSSQEGSPIPGPSSYHAFRKEGPEGYEMPQPSLYHIKKAVVSSNIHSTGPYKLETYFYRGVNTPHTDCWAIEAEAELVNHFGPMSIRPLGMGSNSGVFVLEQKDSGKKHVLRVFSVEGLRNPDYAKNYRLDKSRVGGEWLSIAMDHPCVASSSHLLVWDSTKGFRILTREDALTLLDQEAELAVLDQEARELALFLIDKKEQELELALQEQEAAHAFLDPELSLLDQDAREAALLLADKKVQEAQKALQEHEAALDLLDEEPTREFFVAGTISDFEEGSVDLENALKTGLFSKEEIKAILTDLFTGMVAIHNEDICHRDLKLSNVLLLPSGRAQIIDFGSATQASERLRMSPGSLRMSRGGDFTYHPAENIFQSEQRSGKKADSYGLFRMTYHLLTGKDFFDGIHQFSNGQARLTELTYRHRHQLDTELTKGFTKILQEDPALLGVESELIELMSVMGTDIVSKRILPEAALQMPYFRDREVEVA